MVFPKDRVGGTSVMVSTGGVMLIEFEIPAIAVTVSVALIVWFPAVFRVAMKDPAPLFSLESAGSAAWPSVLVKCTVPE